MSQSLIAIISGMIGLAIGGICIQSINRYLDTKAEYLSGKRDHLQFVYAPLEILTRINNQEFDRYLKNETSNEEREFIEQQIWYPNNIKIRDIIMEDSHLLDEVPEELIKLLTYVNAWLAEYDLVYIRKLKEAPVYARPQGYHYPGDADEFVARQASQLRKEVSL